MRSATPPSRHRATLAIAGSITLVAVVLLIWKLRGGDEAAAPAPTPTAPAATPTAHVVVPPPARDTPAASSEPAVEPADRPQPVAIDPSEAPSRDAPISKPAPAQVPFTREETIAKREADLKLLDDTRARLERDLATAKTGSNTTVVRGLEVRITRMTNVRKQRSAELDAMRAGGPLPP